MIDVNDLDGLLELANDYVDDGLHFLTEPVSYGDLVILVERIIAAEKDAARYRFIKQWNQSYSLNVYRKDLWDDVVDKAMWMESQCRK